MSYLHQGVAQLKSCYEMGHRQLADNTHGQKIRHHLQFYLYWGNKYSFAHIPVCFSKDEGSELINVVVIFFLECHNVEEVRPTIIRDASFKR